MSEFEEGVSLEKYVELAKEMGAIDAKVIDTSTIVVENWVRLKCLYGCKRTGNTYSCPPNNNITPDEMRIVISEFSYALLIKIDRWSKVYKLVYDMERRVFLDGNRKAFGLVAGACNLCPVCALKDKLPCRKPDLLRPAMEAVGIDVFETAKNNGYELKVVTCEEDARAYFGIVLCY